MSTINKNILLWCWGRRGGAPNFVWYLSRALLKRQGIRVSLSISNQSERYNDFNFEQFNSCFNINTYNDKISALISFFKIPIYRKRFRQFLIENKIDIVVCPFFHIWNAFFIDIIRDVGCKYVSYAHDAAPHPGEAYWGLRWLQARDLRAADKIVCLSEHVKLSLVNHQSYSADKIVLSPHGVFEYVFESRSRQYQSLQTPIELLFFGRLLKYKGLSVLLKAYQLIRDERKDVRLRIIGSGKLSADEMKQVRNDNTIYLEQGWVSESRISDIFSKADIVLLPYIESSQSGVIPIAAANAIPAVATPVGGLVEQVRDGINGVIARSCEPRDFADAVLKLMSSSTLYNNCVAGMRALVGGELSWDVIVDDLIKNIV